MKRILLIVSCCFLFSNMASSQANLASVTTERPELRKEKTTKNPVVKLSPNPSSSGKIRVSSKTSETLHFYIFDIEGTLVYHTVLTNKEKKQVENLKKGTYTYDVFAQDESIEEGKIIVK